MAEIRYFRIVGQIVYNPHIIPYERFSPHEKLAIRVLELFDAEDTDDDRREMMDHWINFLYWRDLYPKEAIDDLHGLQTPAELVRATISLANQRIDDLMLQFPELGIHPENVVRQLIPSLEELLSE